MKRTTLLAAVAATLALSACTASPVLPVSATDGASASTSDGAPEAAADFTDPTRPQFGGAIGGP